MLSLPLVPYDSFLSCALDVKEMREIWSSSVLSHHTSTYPAHNTPPLHFYFSEGKGRSLPQGICVWRAVSVTVLHYCTVRPFSLALSIILFSTSSPCPNQIFEGNSNYDTPELRTVEPLLTRFIRIFPERATPAGMGLRLELLGCEIEGKQKP